MTSNEGWNKKHADGSIKKIIWMNMADDKLNITQWILAKKPPEQQNQI